MRILVIGHACSPIRGSEPGITWNHCWHLAAENDVWLITHPQWRDEVEAALKSTPNPRLRVVWVNLPAWMDPWNPARGERGLKWHYIMWQRFAAREAQRLCETEEIQVAHHVSWGTIHEPPRLHRLPVPVAWGPLGGGETIPSAFREYATSWTKERLRRAQIALLPLRPGFRTMARRCALAMASNLETKHVLERGGARRIELVIDCGLPAGYAQDAVVQRPPGEFRLLWAGRLEARKALPLALEAMAQVKGDIRLTVAGDGPLRADYEQMSRRLGVSQRVDILGPVKWDRMPQLFRESHAFLFTSLRDRFGTVVLEAMANALPIITLNHQGVRCFVPDSAGIKAPVATPQETIGALARGIEELASSPTRRQEMAGAALAYARTQTWTERTKVMLDWYAELIR
jgi:glycosyltransferase involved in cell wall biosynthesis